MCVFKIPEFIIHNNILAYIFKIFLLGKVLLLCKCSGVQESNLIYPQNGLTGHTVNIWSLFSHPSQLRTIKSVLQYAA